MSSFYNNVGVVFINNAHCTLNVLSALFCTLIMHMTLLAHSSTHVQSSITISGVRLGTVAVTLFDRPSSEVGLSVGVCVVANIGGEVVPITIIILYQTNRQKELQVV